MKIKNKIQQLDFDKTEFCSFNINQNGNHLSHKNHKSIAHTFLDKFGILQFRQYSVGQSDSDSLRLLGTLSKSSSHDLWLTNLSTIIKLMMYSLINKVLNVKLINNILK